MLNNTNISNLILLTMCLLLTFDDQFNHNNKQITLDKLTIVLQFCFFIAEELNFFCTDVIYSSFSLRFIHYTFWCESFYIYYKYNFLY